MPTQPDHETTPLPPDPSDACWEAGFADGLRAPPDPAALTLEDVLGVLDHVVRVTSVRGGPPGARFTLFRWGPDDDGPIALFEDESPAEREVFEGTIRECLTEAKRLGLLG